MSYFKGSFEEFYKIINPLTRNLVANMSRKAKQHTTCSTPGCNKRTGLEAAHLAGKSRPTITADIVRKMIVAKEVEDFSFSDSCFFANVNKTKTVWWVEPNKDKFNNSWLLLNNTEKREVYLFKIGTKLSTEKLKARDDKNNQYKLEILTEKAPNSFKDRLSGIDFKEFYVQTVKY